MPANEKRRYVMTSDLRQYIAEYTVANFWRYPIRRRVTYASALEYILYQNHKSMAQRKTRLSPYFSKISFITNSEQMSHSL